MKKDTKDTIQWHPAFQASIQIEFEAEAEKLTFEPEHLLSKKPMQMDELIIRVAENEAIHKNIGRIFRRYNIIEYKSPDDNLTINDFYKAYGYCCFYQSDTDKICEIPPEELTITFICNHFPRKMVQHLKEFRRLNIIHVAAGIYYIIGDAFPMQLLVTRELDPKENLWLQSLRNNMSEPEEIETLLKEYETKKSSKLYQTAMEVITRANWDAVKEVKETMCEALKELMAEEFQEQEELVTKRVTEEVTKRVTEQVTEQVTAQVTDQVTEQVTERVTEQVTEDFIRTLSKSITDVNKLAELLNLPVEQINKVLDE